LPVIWLVCLLLVLAPTPPEVDNRREVLHPTCCHEAGDGGAFGWHLADDNVFRDYQFDAGALRANGKKSRLVDVQVLFFGAYPKVRIVVTYRRGKVVTADFRTD
jgi:hypothetical protein